MRYVKGTRFSTVPVDHWRDDCQHLVGLQRQPADGEQADDEHEHLDGLLLVAQDAVIAALVSLAGGAVAPEILHRIRNM